MKRIFLFIVTNLAVLALLSLVQFIVENVFGVRLMRGGTGGMLVRLPWIAALKTRGTEHLGVV